jgi:hypothetical protein
MLRCRRYMVWFLALLLCLATASLAQQNPKRLILKDGSYQSVTKWQIAGDRVRYFSADRYTWEELPKELVDWPATDKYNQEHEQQRTISADELVREEKVDQRAVEAATPAVAPGLRLPDGGGVYVLDVFDSRPQLFELGQNGGEVNKQTGKNILRAAMNPLALSAHQTIEIPGQHAHVQAHSLQPEIFINVEGTSTPTPGPPGSQSDRYRIVRLEPHKENRIVGNLNVGITGKVNQKENWVPGKLTQVGDWMKLTPTSPLQPGEYAVVEMLDKNQVNTFVWDFGVNPNAPRNANGLSPVTPAQATPSGNPVLEKRPH